MKILLRNYNGDSYVWKTAKYDGERFLVNGERFSEAQIVSIINDNRKNYAICSSCGKIFPKRGVQWLKHKELASSIEPCMNCRKLRVQEVGDCNRKIVKNDDGTYTEKTNRVVNVYCHYSSFTDLDLHSPDLMSRCKFRQCGDAHQQEVFDTFIQYPGIFDDIITVDRILDNGYLEMETFSSNSMSYYLNSDLGIRAFVNKLGIVDQFTIENFLDYANVWYSKRYSKLFTSNEYDKYIVWESHLGEDTTKQITEYIANLYK